MQERQHIKQQSTNFLVKEKRKQKQKELELKQQREIEQAKERAERNRQANEQAAKRLQEIAGLKREKEQLEVK